MKSVTKGKLPQLVTRRLDGRANLQFAEVVPTST